MSHFSPLPADTAILLGRRRITGFWAQAGVAAANALGATGTNTGTATIAAMANTNMFTACPRLKFVSAAGAGSSCGTNWSVPAYWRGNAARLGGWRNIIRGGWEVFQASGRAFVGMYASATAIGNVDPSTLLNMVGFGIDSGQTTWRVFSNDGAGAATAHVDTGLPANTSATDLYDFETFCDPGGGAAIGWRITRLNTGAMQEGTITTNLPASDTFLSPHVWGNNGPTAVATEIAYSHIVLETQAW